MKYANTVVTILLSLDAAMNILKSITNVFSITHFVLSGYLRPAQVNMTQYCMEHIMICYYVALCIVVVVVALYITLSHHYFVLYLIN